MVFFQCATKSQLLCLTTLANIVLFLVHAPIPPVQAAPLIGGGTNIERKRYCSNTLSDAIQLICGGRYNSLGRKFPESVGNGAHRSHVLRRFTPQQDDEIFYRPLQNGPIHECCRRPCGYSELKLYCAPDDGFN